MKKLGVSLCAGIFLCLLSCYAFADNVIVNHNNYKHYDSVSETVQNSVAAQKVFFAHASVGGNIVSGMEDLNNSNSNLYKLQNVAAEASPPDTSEGVFYDYDRGNPGWESKITEFEIYVSNGWHSSAVNVAINKFCYIDTDANWETYRDSMQQLESTYPETIFVYMTMPLKTDTDSEDGWLRQQFNASLRDWINTQDGKYLLDIADVEAHSAVGVESTSSWNGNAYQILVPGYSSDGGHLNETGRQRMAKAVYSLLALIADPTEASVPTTDQALIWYSSDAGKSVFWRIAESGSLVNDNINIGWGFVSDSSLGSSWKLIAAEIIHNAKVLFWHNIEQGRVVYWKLNDSYKLTDDDDSGWGFVSDTTMSSEWGYSGLANTDDGTFILWQNSSSGQVVYWKLRTDAPTIVNTTRDDGWGFVDSEATLSSDWRLAASFYDSNVGQLLTWQNQQSGKVVWWKLTDACKLTNRTKDDGWGFVSDEITLNSDWHLVGPITSGSNNLLIWQNENSGQPVWWKLNVNSCVLQDTTKNSGWGFVSEAGTVNSNWRLAAISTLGSTPSLFWRQRETGKAVWWKLNDTGTLVDTTRSSGWGFVSDELAVSDSWSITDALK